MDQGIPRELSTRTSPVSGVLFEMQRNIFEFLHHASFLIQTAANCGSSSEEDLTFQSILDIEELLFTIQRLLRYWEEEMQITLCKNRLSGRKETVLSR